MKRILSCDRKVVQRGQDYATPRDLNHPALEKPSTRPYT